MVSERYLGEKDPQQLFRASSFLSIEKIKISVLLSHFFLLPPLTLPFILENRGRVWSLQRKWRSLLCCSLTLWLDWLVCRKFAMCSFDAMTDPSMLIWARVFLGPFVGRLCPADNAARHGRHFPFISLCQAEWTEPHREVQRRRLEVNEIRLRIKERILFLSVKQAGHCCTGTEQH